MTVRELVARVSALPELTARRLLADLLPGSADDAEVSATAALLVFLAAAIYEKQVLPVELLSAFVRAVRPAAEQITQGSGRWYTNFVGILDRRYVQIRQADGQPITTDLITDQLTTPTITDVFECISYNLRMLIKD